MLPSLIIQQLLDTEEYWRRVLPHLKAEYFDHPGDKVLFGAIEAYANKYNSTPPRDALMVELSERVGDDVDLESHVQTSLNELSQLTGEVQSIQWLVDKTESFCQEAALHNAVRRAIRVLDGQEKDIPKGMLPKILDEALGITFDTRIGHDYFKDWEERWEEMHRDSVRLPFDIEFLNKITKGGIYQKTLTCFMAASGVGKSIMMCHMAAANLAMGKNVMYVSCEMSEFRLAERIDMNLMGLTDDEVRAMSKEEYKAKLERVKARMKPGRLVFKEYPTSTVGVAHIRALLNEAKRKDGFVPDVLYVDYLNIMISTKVKDRSNTYSLVKAIAEELRGLSVEFNIPIVTATQVNRDGYSASDFGMENTSESMGLVHTLDLFLALIQTEELAQQNQVLVKQLKNRYRDENRDKKFVIGMDKSKMKVYDVEASAQRGLNATDRPKPSGGAQNLPKPGGGTKRDFSAFS